MLKEKKTNILKLLRTYRTLKGNFKRFKNICNKLLQEKNELQIRFRDLGELACELVVFDVPVRLSCSLAFDPDDTPFGRIGFDCQPATGTTAVRIWELYFDELGNVKTGYPQEPTAFNMLNAHDLDAILVSMVEQLLEGAFFKAAQPPFYVAQGD
jgi:hypothetical protein